MNYYEELNYFNDLFTNAKIDNKFVKLYEFYLSVDNIEFYHEECNLCKTTYTDMKINGIIYTPYKYRTLKYNSAPYTGSISSIVILCNCKILEEILEDDENQLLLFRCIIHNNKRKFLCRRYLKKDDGIYIVENIGE